MVPNILRKVTAILLLLLLVVPITAQGQEIKVTLLGTGAHRRSSIDSARAPWSKPEDRSFYSMRVEGLCNASLKSMFRGRLWTVYSSRTFTRITLWAFRIYG